MPLSTIFQLYHGGQPEKNTSNFKYFLAYFSSFITNVVNLNPTQAIRYVIICQGLAAGWYFFPADHHDITEILLKVELNTMTPNPSCRICIC
jgi:hypothetical protein